MAVSDEVRDRPQAEGDELRTPTRISPVPLDPDREAWERQSAERMIYYRWFSVYLEQETGKKERSVDEAYKRISPDITRIRFREIARIWGWERRVELFDEYVFRNNREAYITEMARMASRQARVGIITAGMGAAVLRDFTAQLRDKIVSGELKWEEAKALLPTAIRAIEVGQREERLARGFQRAIAMPEPNDSDFSDVVDHFSAVSGPEVDAAFRQLEEVLVERITVRRTVESRPALPQPVTPVDEPHYPEFPDYENEGDEVPRLAKSQERIVRESSAKTKVQNADRERAWVRDNEVELTENDLSVEGTFGDHARNIPLLAEQRMRELRRNLSTDDEEEEIIDLEVSDRGS